MNTIEAIYASGRIVQLILVPVFREIAAVLLAVAITKDCKARDNGSGALWGLFTLLAPILSGIIYAIYSRALVDRKGKTEKDKKNIKISKWLTFLAVCTYILSIIIAIVAVIATIASEIALS